MVERIFKKVRKQQIKRMNAHLEKLGAAFTLETGLRASDAALVQRDLEGGVKEYVFTRRTFNPADTSPEVQEMFALCMELSRAESQEEKEEGIRLIKEFTERFKEEES